eukprot:1002723-Amphidinium_carterae.1
MSWGPVVIAAATFAPGTLHWICGGDCVQRQSEVLKTKRAEDVQHQILTPLLQSPFPPPNPTVPTLITRLSHRNSVFVHVCDDCANCGPNHYNPT